MLLGYTVRLGSNKQARNSIVLCNPLSKLDNKKVSSHYFYFSKKRSWGFKPQRKYTIENKYIWGVIATPHPPKLSNKIHSELLSRSRVIVWKCKTNNNYKTYTYKHIKAFLRIYLIKYLRTCSHIAIRWNMLLSQLYHWKSRYTVPVAVNT